MCEGCSLGTFKQILQKSTHSLWWEIIGYGNKELNVERMIEFVYISDMFLIGKPF